MLFHCPRQSHGCSARYFNPSSLLKELFIHEEGILFSPKIGLLLRNEDLLTYVWGIRKQIAFWIRYALSVLVTFPSSSRSSIWRVCRNSLSRRFIDPRGTSTLVQMVPRHEGVALRRRWKCGGVAQRGFGRYITIARVDS